MIQRSHRSPTVTGPARVPSVAMLPATPGFIELPRRCRVCYSGKPMEPGVAGKHSRRDGTRGRSVTVGCDDCVEFMNITPGAKIFAPFIQKHSRAISS